MKKTFLKGMAILLGVALLLPMSGCAKKDEFEVTVLSQNLRITASDGEENEIMLRSTRFLEIVDKYKPDLIGMQEFDPSWDFFLYSEFEDRNYGLLYEYRGPGSYEATPIAYNRDKFELIEEKYFWLSDTPEEASPSWDDGNGKRCRIVTECIFREKETGMKFAFLNTHFGLTEKAEINSSLLLHSWIKEKYADTPVILTGDFNMREDGAGYPYLITGDAAGEGEALLQNSRLVAPEKGMDCGTSNGFKERESFDQYTSIIDFVFVTKQISPLYYSVLTDKPDGYFVSDHFGVLTRQLVKK